MALGWRGSYYRYKEFFLDISALYKKRADLRAFLEIILSISTIVLFIIFALRPTAITIIDLLQQIKEKQGTLTALTKKVTDLQAAGVVLSQNQQFIPNIDIAVPTSPNPDVLSEQIEGLAAKDSIQILGISFDQLPIIGPPTQRRNSEFLPLPGNAEEMPFSISVKGTYANSILFFKDLENLRISKEFDSLGLSSSTTEKGVTVVTVITGRVPYVGQ